MTSSSHDLLRHRLTAFFFNTRGDALRAELYRALALDALARLPSPSQIEAIASHVLNVLGAAESQSSGVKAILAEELNTLQEKGLVTHDQGGYALANPTTDPPRTPEVSTVTPEPVREEIRLAALEIAPHLSDAALDELEAFFFDAANIIATSQLPFLTRSQSSPAAPSDMDVASAVSDSRAAHHVDAHLDGDRFISSIFITPRESVNSYLYSLYQVTVSLNLLAWDPTLVFVRDSVLARIELYLDTNILFVLMQPTNPMCEFLTALIRATRNDLGVRVHVHSSTLAEYEGVLRWGDSQFEHYQGTLRDIARICKRDGSNPRDYIEPSVFIDYLSQNMEHVDLGSWQRYVNSVSIDALQHKLADLGIREDESRAFVPQEEFESLKDGILRASRTQVERGKRREEKVDASHDARLYYLISSKRKRRSEQDVTLGYDTYLLSLDGSLVYFMQEVGVPWTETYVIFPNQWYELSFPFFRVAYATQQDFASAVTSLVFSPAFPALASLIPLRLCSYIFDIGGSSLPLGSLHEVVRTAMEQRLAQELDPSNRDKRKREEAALQIQRLIAAEELRKNQELKSVEQETNSLRAEAEALTGEIRDLGAKKTELDRKIKDHDRQVRKIGKTDAQLEALRSVYSDEIEKLSAKHVEEIRRAEADAEAAAAEKDNILQQKDETISTLQGDVTAIRTSLEKLQDAVDAERVAREQRDSDMALRRKKIRMTLITALMLAGMLMSLLIMTEISVPLQFLIAAVALLALGSVLLHATPRPVYSFTVYGLGLLIAAGSALSLAGQQTWLWILPMAWEIIVVGVNSAFRQAA